MFVHGLVSFSLLMVSWLLAGALTAVVGDVAALLGPSWPFFCKFGCPKIHGNCFKDRILLFF